MTDYILDIETTLDHKVLRLADLYVPGRDGHISIMNKDILEMKMTGLVEGDKLIGHNITGFDIPVIKDIWDLDILKMQEEQGFIIVDTLTVAKLLHPDLPGGNSLRAWAERMHPDDESKFKGTVDYDHALISDLWTYCKQDCEITNELYIKFVLELNLSKGNYKHPLRVEQKVQDIVNQQVRTKVHFDVDRAENVLSSIEYVMGTVERKLDKELPILAIPENKIDYPPKKQFVKSGDLSMAMLKYLDRHKARLHKDSSTLKYSITYGKRTNIELPLKSPLDTTYQLKPYHTAELKEWLLGKGWEPTMWNFRKDKTTGKKKKSSPKLSDKGFVCPNLEKVGIGYGNDIAEWLMLRHRKNCIRSDAGAGWLSKLDENDDIASEADPLGTPTARFRHKGIANVPRITSPWGKELRSLFCAREGKMWVGWDASSLEACMEAHYTFPFDDGEYARELMAGDVHQKNADALGLTRDQAKTFKYAVTYGAQPPKLAAEFGWSLVTARDIYTEFWKANPALAKLKHHLELEWEGHFCKHLVGLDGRLITTRSRHSILNSKFQGAGAVVMKHSMLIAEKTIKSKFKAEGLIRYHDEEIWECNAVIAHPVGRLGAESVKLAGQFLKLNVELSAEYKIGKNWAEVH